MRMFCSALNIGSRLKLWKMKPIRCRRSSVSWLSFIWVMSAPSNTMRPDVAESSPASVCMSVDLPEPDGPMIAVNRPCSNRTLTPRSACTAVSPRP